MRVLSVLIMLLSALPASSQTGGLFTMTSVEDGRGWEAVGRLEIAGEAFCTGALIEPRLVLTAAHCLFDPETGQRVASDDIQFLAGWRNGRAAAYRRVRHALPHPDFDFASAADAGRVRNDIALIELQHPIRNTTISPFATDIRPIEGAKIGVVSYAHDRSDAPSLQEMCGVVARQDGVLVMSCEVDFGSSGSPVFSFESGRPRIVSVVSGKATLDGVPVSLGTALEGPLDILRAGMADLSIRHRVSAGMRNATGAKFIRP